MSGRRDQFWSLITFASTLAMVALVAVASRAPATQPSIKAVVRIAIVVDDADRSADFYENVLSFTKIADFEVGGKPFETLQGIFGARARVVDLRLGDEELELTQYLTPGGREVPRDSRSNDRWFQHIAIITSDMDRAYSLLRAHHIRRISSEPQRLPDSNRNAAGIRAFYFFDPDHHVLEILQFPSDKGLPKWHASDRLFLGIDHTAIVVSDTEQSLRFYRDVLGMHVVGESENYGDEQEHLNNVLGAHLRITSLRAAAGPGIELLEYLTPRDGRPYPADAHANDLFNWETIITVADPGQLLSKARTEHLALVSANVPSSVTDAPFAFRDPDGHAIQVRANTEQP
jgi:catechol 2,3-dioxygenase-like lactoylglutathione lyase family enzyme